MKKNAPPKWWDSNGFVEASRCAIYFHLYSSTTSVKIQSWRLSKDELHHDLNHKNGSVKSSSRVQIIE